MASNKAFGRNLISCIPFRDRFCRIFESSLTIETACTTYIQFPLRFRVEINKNITIQHTGLQSSRTCHACLFINSKERLNRPMLQLFGFEYCKSGTNAKTIICSQCSPGSVNPITYYTSLDGLLFKNKFYIVIFLRHHIEVSLKNYTLPVLHPLCSRFSDNNITNLVLYSFQA